MAGLVPAIYALHTARRTWMPGPSPRRSGFGRAGGTSPGMTNSCEQLPSLGRAHLGGALGFLGELGGVFGVVGGRGGAGGGPRGPPPARSPAAPPPGGGAIEGVDAGLVHLL